ncbi:hypothetical protein GCM10027036_40610 [Flavihumibacter cheonanensis]|uniref:tetratricopeptide repeat protein n=1 Tax=Flavihumibacter cheonanensis TaxID=1442385 RepID=UPI001EF838E5|nr:hypothetical protein [Flavihumibacter cheonanensis]MCG7754853.1 hypothetical protein [Flavihumibacter cheonanensis]
MNIQDIFSIRDTYVFVVTNDSSADELSWEVEPTNQDLIPNVEGIYFVAAKKVYTDKTVDCFLGVMTPERIAETVIKLVDDKVFAESIYDQKTAVIPAVASKCFGDYNLYYAKENPQIGIDVLRTALATHSTVATIAEDLGYILRDENRLEEALEAFHHAEKVGASSEYVYLELSKLYKQLGDTDKEKEYEKLFANS